MIEILDASTAIKWFVRNEESGLAAADDVLTRVILAPQDFAVPALFLYEVQAALCRRLHDGESVLTCLRKLLALGLTVVEPDETLLTLATHVAVRHRLTGYDAAYVALALHLQGIWLTFDAPAYARVQSLNAARLLGSSQVSCGTEGNQ